jgi:hypothetical protein
LLAMVLYKVKPDQLLPIAPLARLKEGWWSPDSLRRETLNANKKA